jgi:hypothetical protein
MKCAAWLWVSGARLSSNNQSFARKLWHLGHVKANLANKAQQKSSRFGPFYHRYGHFEIMVGQ